MSAAYVNHKGFSPHSLGTFPRFKASTRNRRLVVASNRLPIKFTEDGRAEMSSGGLVTAMVPVLNKRGGLWIGWPGTMGDVRTQLDQFAQNRPYSLRPIPLSQEDMDGFYTGFANQVLWPLFHGFHTKCVFDSLFWDAYDRVNQKFAQEVTANSTQDDYIWIHDYHLINVAQKIKEAGLSRQCGLYLHIPFPSPDVFLNLPWREEILTGFLKYDLIGFQTDWDLTNFLRTVSIIFPEYKATASHALSHLNFGGKTISAGAFPISIDFDEFSRHAARVAPRSDFQDQIPEHQTVLGVDRLDYSKGIPQRLRAFAQVLQDHPEVRQKITLIQVVVPSRESVEEYQRLKKKIERLVGEMNYQVDPEQLLRRVPGTAWIGIQIGEPRARGKGIGAQAMHYLEERIRDRGLRRIELGVFEFNKPARTLYRRLGYREFGRIPDFTFWKGKMWEDIRMEKILTWNLLDP